MIASRLFFALLLSTNQASAAPQLTLEQFLDQVNGKSPTVAAQKLRIEAGKRRSESAEVLTFPYLFGAANKEVDKAEKLIPASMGTETKSTFYSVGLGMDTPFGLNGRYTWNNADYQVFGTSSALATAGRYSSYNRLDLTLNLGRNGFGSEVRARKELIRAGNMAQSLANQYAYNAKQAEAEATYWRLGLARQSVLVQKDILERAGRLLDWAKRRVGLQLGDRSDLLQAQASHDLYTLGLATAVEEEKSAARAFNLLRNQESDSVPEAVAFPTVDEMLKMQAPEKQGERLDVQAAAERTRATQAQVQLDREALKPNVDLTAAYSWNGRDPARSEAVSEAYGSKYPYSAIGITFKVPLNVPTWTSSMRGAGMDIEAADLELEQARINEAKEWRDITSRLKDARLRLGLVRTLESAQKAKFENERTRLQRGRSTTFQSLTFEQDYAQAQLTRLRTQAEVLQILAQMRTYEGSIQ
jgi:outer membrane protein TolC